MQIEDISLNVKIFIYLSVIEEKNNKLINIYIFFFFVRTMILD